MMAKLSDDARDFIRLVLRSADVGEGWRKLSKLVHPLAARMAFQHPDLFEMAKDMAAIRLTERGCILADYI